MCPFVTLCFVIFYIIFSPCHLHSGLLHIHWKYCVSPHRVSFSYILFLSRWRNRSSGDTSIFYDYPMMMSDFSPWFRRVCFCDGVCTVRKLLAPSRSRSCLAFGIPRPWAQSLRAGRRSGGFVQRSLPPFASLACYNEAGMLGMWVCILLWTHK